MQTYFDGIKTTASLLAEADYVLVGAGAGLSAAAGLNYQDPELFAQWYPQFKRLGLRTIWEGITSHWAPDDMNRNRFWAFWAHHIQKIRYNPQATLAYLQLFHLISAKTHFVITTNVDGQFFKAGFNPDLVFTPQGDYGLFQCDQPCCDSLHDNRSAVARMLSNMDQNHLSIRDEDIPLCPACGSYLERNLRRDHHFVEATHMRKQAAYADFVNRCAKQKLLLLEIGVGFNTPSIIRWPFERIVAAFPHAALIRVNTENASVPNEITEKTIAFKEDAVLVIQDLLNAKG